MIPLPTINTTHSFTPDSSPIQSPLPRPADGRAALERAKKQMPKCPLSLLWCANYAHPHLHAHTYSRSRSQRALMLAPTHSQVHAEQSDDSRRDGRGAGQDRGGTTILLWGGVPVGKFTGMKLEDRSCLVHDKIKASAGLNTNALVIVALRVSL